ncbi:MAG: dTDP-4-dehydrorhamnose 3,5-epimerase [Candidatus Omnitrophica bacterium]|nr:dTDP-4-dehydrorhamnose 3,5-epimerase [Candidatus Omnitrophota bacterium]
MKFTKMSLPDLILIEPDLHKDARGFFFEDYNKETFAAAGVLAEFVQDNHSLSNKGVLRGLHFQVSPRAQDKLVRVVRGEAFDVIVDVREGSKTLGKFVTTALSAKNRKMIFIPEGFAHGFLALEDGTEFLYKVSRVYSAPHERGIAWDDPDLKIPWPKTGGRYFLSEKDGRHPSLKTFLKSARATG